MAETDLYAPVKAFLEAQGYVVKSEISGADVVAMRPDDLDPVIVEMKQAMNLTLIHQGIDRQAITDFVYLAVPVIRGRKARTRHVSLCRRLGLGLLTVRLKDGFVEVLCDPASFVPRKSRKRQGGLLKEFRSREGDPNLGGTNGAIVTAYRQDAWRCAAHLASAGPSRGAEVARGTGVDRATAIMRDNHCGWFRKVARGTYELSEEGQRASGQISGHDVNISRVDRGALS